MQTFDILIKVIPMFITIALGYMLTQKNILTQPIIGGLKTVIVNITLPASVFQAIVKVRLQPSYFFVIISVIVASVLLYIIGKFIKKIFSIQYKYFPFLMCGFEGGMMGYPLYSLIFGAAALPNLAVLGIASALFAFLIYVPLILMQDHNEKGLHALKTSFKITIKSPTFWAILLGVIGSFVGVQQYENTQMFQAVDSLLSFAALPTAFLISLVIGSGLKISTKNIGKELLTALVKPAIALCFALLLRYAVFQPLGVKPEITTALFLLFTLPASFLLPVFMKNPSEKELNFVSNTLSIGAFVGVIGFSIIALSSI